MGCLRRGGGSGDGHPTMDDPWMSTVTSVAAFLAGFSLASVVVIADGPEHFRWPGVAALALTIASVVLILAAQGSRRGAYYYERSTEGWRRLIWAMYHGGIIALLVGLGGACPSGWCGRAAGSALGGGLVSVCRSFD
jgi:hypothetical protein